MNAPNINVGTVSVLPRPAQEYRYGIFIQPPPEIALPALRIMKAAQDLYGFHAAMAYPPHITLLGSIVLDDTEDQLITILDDALTRIPPIPMHGVGLNAKIGAAVGVNYQNTQGGEQNTAIADLYETLRKATVPLRGYQPSDRKAAERREKENREHFHAHLTVLGHDGIDNPSIRNAAISTLEQLALELPDNWTATTVTLYRFWSADWSNKYWLTQEWIPLRSWELGS